ncbi:MAG: hypothetical protein EOO43_14205 [Flavobacterium sp.]|nr:MAG: hypothetical protein EOO43_14205 [Flavobacterium sp.]
MNIDWTNIVTGLLAFLLGLLVKTLLDHNLAIWIVKYFNNTPVRFIYRTSPHNISGFWEQIWEFAAGESFTNSTERHSHTRLKQLGKYIYGEFYSASKEYYLFGEIKDNYIIGHWSDKNDKLGYFGSFEIRIVDSNCMEGKWIGHSKKTQMIYGDLWNWKKIR